MSDAEIIQKAYELELIQMFNVYFSSCVGYDPEQAAARFTNGLQRLRIARDAALKIVGAQHAQH